MPNKHLVFLLTFAALVQTACSKNSTGDGEASNPVTPAQPSAGTGTGSVVAGSSAPSGGSSSGSGVPIGGGVAGSRAAGSGGASGTLSTDGDDAGAPTQATAGSSGSTTTTGPTAGSGAAAMRVDNPFAGAKGYVNPEWSKKAAAESGGDRVANTPTAVWLDRIASIKGTSDSQSNGAMGLADHLNAALTQGANSIEFVIYDLPGRDCSALASNGELGPTDLPRYEMEYIDPIAAIMADPKYSQIRIINVIEPDSLPNLVTNTDVATCMTMKSNGGYVQGVSYALKKLGAIANVYNYIDAGHHGWLGWSTNIDPSAQLFADTVKTVGFDTVQGFITNTANYSALKEPFFDSNTMVGSTSVKMSKWVDFNDYVDELSYAQALRTKLVALGFDSKIGMLIDTSRNGWGGPMRPTAKSSSTDVDTFVNESRIDRRIQAGNWCNQSGAGLGERPKASPADGIDAYVWIKPPGESDGSSMMIQNSDGKGFDRMCDPTYAGNERNGNNMTGALDNAPLSGTWFSAQFQELMKNADPAL
ncbi:MAG TPA: glycoside hydrolase family 6 protein [Polyangiales bacterium]|nr:glycoside hydrolase family 6 protein [Polyangiales bacterium]